MDPRVTEQAEIIVDHCLKIEEGDEVVINAPPAATDLVVALYESIADRGGYPLQINFGGETRSHRAFLRAMDPEMYDEPPETHLELAKAADAAIAIRGWSNTHETNDVKPTKNTAYRKLIKPISDEIMSKRWTGTQHPTPASAQDAEMSIEAYTDFVYDAINKDWEAQREFQSNMVDILEAGSEVRIVSGDTTDLAMSIAGNHALNDYGELNLPGGEVYTAPVPDSVTGEVLFDKPLIYQGRVIEEVHLSFNEGKVTAHRAAKNEEMLTALLDADDGSHRLGELGIGMNRDIDHFTYNMLFDEKMGDTVHMALGFAYPETVGEDNEQNDSAVHVDMIVNMSEESYIEVDGEIVQRNGTFVFEDGFAK